MCNCYNPGLSARIWKGMKHFNLAKKESLDTCMVDDCHVFLVSSSLLVLGLHFFTISRLVSTKLNTHISSSLQMRLRNTFSIVSISILPSFVCKLFGLSHFLEYMMAKTNQFRNNMQRFEVIMSRVEQNCQFFTQVRVTFL